MKIILRQVYVYKNEELLYYRHFGKALKEEAFNNLVGEIMDDAFGRNPKEIEYHDYYKYRISYTTNQDLNLIFLFVTGLTDDFDNIKKELLRCKKEFLNLFEDILQHRFDAKTFEVFDPTIDSIHRNLRPKITLIGFSGVGKTTITRLIKAEEIPMQHVPTITGDIATIKIGKLHFHLWDNAGQEQFSYLWSKFLKGSDAVLLITDSTLENVEKSKFFLELINESAPNSQVAVIGNKQDLPEAMEPDNIERILGIKTYSMIATDPDNRDKMIQIIADILEMSAEVSPLLQPLLERDELTEEARNALEKGEFSKAALLFEKISDLCIELGDDGLGKEFYQKSQKIKKILKLEEEEEAPEAEIPEPSAPADNEVEEKPEKAPQGPPPAPKTETPEAEIPEPSAPADNEVEEKPEKAPQGPPLTPKSEPAKTVNKPKKPEIKNLEKPKVKKISGLKLNPADFMVKSKPKSITSVPKDAKNKLKTSPFEHVKNPEKKKKRKAVSPTELIKATPKKKPQKPAKPKPQSPTVTKPIKPPADIQPQKSPEEEKSVEPTTSKASAAQTTETPAAVESTTSTPSTEGIDPQQKKDLKKTLVSLKIKKTDIENMALDFEMKELSGEITGEELEQKKARLEAMEQKIEKRIKDIQDMLN